MLWAYHTKQLTAGPSECHPSLLGDIIQVWAGLGLASIVLHHDAHTSFPFITIGVNWNHLELVVSHFGKNGSHKARSLTRHGVRCENIRDSIETKACLSVMF
jgi:hypothetical protein